MPSGLSNAALGFRAHSGWTATVAVTLAKDGPQVLLRQRTQLVETFTYKFRQPYHTAEKMPLEKARAFVSRVESQSRSLADKAVRFVQAELRKQGYEATHCGLLRSASKPLPALEKVLLSHALIHAADGELFRQALVWAGQRSRMSVFTIAERELFAVACTKLRIKQDDLMSRLKALGKAAGPPWAQDEKFAALAAWLALRSSLATRGPRS